MGSNHCEDVCSDEHYGITVEALEVLPHRLAPFNDGVQMWRPAIRLRSRLQVDAVKHRFNCGNYSVKVFPLGPGLLH